MKPYKYGIFHLLGLFAGNFFDELIDYEMDKDDEQPTFLYNKDNVLTILKNAESGESDKVALAKDVLIKMEQHECDWDWKEYWVNEPEIGYDYDPNDKKVPTELQKIVEIINNDLDEYDFKRMFEEFDI